VVRGMVADGTLKPGQRVPSARSLAGLTGAGESTCRKAVLVMVDGGELELARAGAPYGRPRVPGGPAPGPGGELAGRLAAARRAAGLTQAELALAAGVSADTVVSAETGQGARQKQATWAALDQALRADGALARAHARLRAAGT
jgi:DNA-binding transcriptional MocR family regulator